MSRRYAAIGIFAVYVAAALQLRGQSTDAPLTEDRATSYILAPNDLVDIKVFQEDDLESKLRISRDGIGLADKGLVLMTVSTRLALLSKYEKRPFRTCSIAS